MLWDVEGLWVDEEEQVCHPEEREQYQGCPDSPFHLRKVIFLLIIIIIISFSNFNIDIRVARTALFTRE